MASRYFILAFWLVGHEGDVLRHGDSFFHSHRRIASRIMLGSNLLVVGVSISLGDMGRLLPPHETGLCGLAPRRRAEVS